MTTKAKNPAAVALGRLGGLANKGIPCPARAKPKELCQKAAFARWRKWRREKREALIKQTLEALH